MTNSTTAPAVDLDQIPDELTALPQWVVWKYVVRDDKPTKIPFNARTGGAADSTQPETWSTFEEAVRAYRGRPDQYAGIGYVFATDDPFVGVDQDNCRDDAGNLTEAARDILDELWSYTEVSPSQHGVKTIVRAPALPPTSEGGRRRSGNIEMYSEGRFFTITGQRLNLMPATIEERAAELKALYDRTFAKPEKKTKPAAAARPTPQADDQRVIDKIIADVKYAMLWSGDDSGYTSASEADLALMGRIGFFTGWDPSRMESLFGQSGRAREKWTSRADYRQWTVDKARAGKTDSYNWNGNRGTHTNGRAESTEPKPPPVIVPIPLDAPVPPELPTGVFHGWLGDMVEAVAEATETPQELPAAFALAAVATLVQRRISVRIRQGYFEPLNLWPLCALPPGNRKTGVVIEMNGPLSEIERKWAAEMGPQVEAAMSERKSAEARISYLRDQMKKAGENEAYKRQAAEIAELEANLPQVPTVPILYGQDVTPETASTLIAQNGGRLSLISDEGGIFENIGGRYSNGIPNQDVFLQAHAGGTIKVHRKDKQVHIPHPALTIAISPQPDVLKGLGAKKDFRGRGLLARFLYMVPASRLGFRNGHGEPVPDEVRGRYRDALFSLAEVQPNRDGTGDEVPHVLYFGDDALVLWESFWLEVEALMREGGRLAHITDWAGKLPGAVARIAGLLHLADYASAPLDCKTISLDTVARAITFGRYLIDHACIAFGLMGADEDLEAARHMWRAIQIKELRELTARDAWQLVRGRYPKMEQVDGAFDALIDHGYLAEPHQADDMPRKKGRPPSRRFMVNPALTEGWQ